MRTRRSPRNQERLWRQLGAAGAAHPSPVTDHPSPVTPRACGLCKHYPRHGRSRGECRDKRGLVYATAVAACFVPRVPGARS